jgi:hypothetical protein
MVIFFLIRHLLICVRVLDSLPSNMPGSAITFSRSQTQTSFPTDAPCRQPRLMDVDYGVTEPEYNAQSPNRYYTVDKKLEEQRETLRILLHEKEREMGPLPNCTIADQSESCSRSHWARKIVLSLGKWKIFRKRDG